MRTIISLILVGLIGFSFSFPNATSKNENSILEPGAWVYQHRDFKGGRIRISFNGDLTSFTKRYKGPFGAITPCDVCNDEISSISVPDGWMLVCFEHENFDGDYTIFRGDIPYVGDAWNDRISSAKLMRE